MKYFIQWDANLAENVNINLYKSGAFQRTIVTNTSTGAYEWEAALNLIPASDYSIRISSATNPTLFDGSDAAFSIVDAPAINTDSVTRLPDGSVEFILTAPGAATATVLASTNLTDWEVLQTVPITDGTATFIDSTMTNFVCRCYRLRVP